MYNTINKRLREFIEYKKIIYTDFADAIGRSKQELSNWLNNAPAIPAKHLIRIIEIFPDINANWLIRGEGEMLLHQDNQVMFRYGKKDVKEPEPEYNNATVEALFHTSEMQKKLIDQQQALINALQGNSSQTG